MHNEAIEKCEILSRTLWQNVLFHFVLSSLIICISCLMIIKSDGVEGIVFVFYLCAYTFQIYTYSACGNLLIDSSLRVNDAAYNFHWYKCDARIRKAINLIMIRAQKKVNVEVPFFEVSLETFASVSIKLRNASLFQHNSQKFTGHATWWLIYNSYQNVFIKLLFLQQNQL